jgi:hypothetical protein
VVEWHFAPLQQETESELPHLMVTGVDVTERVEADGTGHLESAFS